ncbi:spore coat protein [Salibacterium salarium]|uniref:Spore coat protein n=1 Tax=Salibacterium salarium TaxID=284579 RepID=A0A3R9RDJ5_9BACI|nr:spore coat protein [Salibacterium salarium]RSL33054.1 spore coat protein [Salibacterium salarium]
MVKNNRHCDKDRDRDRNRGSNRNKDRSRDRDRRNKNRRWNALDPSSDMSCSGNNNDSTQHGEQTNKTLQISEDYIEIIDCCDVSISNTDIKGALSIQAGIQAAILILITVSIGGDSDSAEEFTQDLIQSAKIKQLTYQHTYLENSRDVTIDINDTQLALNIQLLIQLLVAVAVVLDIF